MKANTRRSILCSALVAMLLLLGSGPARADEPMLAIRHTGGDSSIYPVSEIMRVSFEGDNLLVVQAGGADTHPMDEIARIEFLWDFSAVDDPREVATMLNVMHLFQNQPNPFSPETRIDFDLPQNGSVELGIYSVNGRLIRTLIRDERTAGSHSVKWDGRDDQGERVAGGVYFYSLVAPGIEESRQMILLP